MALKSKYDPQKKEKTCLKTKQEVKGLISNRRQVKPKVSEFYFPFLKKYRNNSDKNSFFLQLKTERWSVNISLTVSLDIKYLNISTDFFFF